VAWGRVTRAIALVHAARCQIYIKATASTRSIHLEDGICNTYQNLGKSSVILRGATLKNDPHNEHDSHHYRKQSLKVPEKVTETSFSSGVQ
jgi:hypothetical protein